MIDSKQKLEEYLYELLKFVKDDNINFEECKWEFVNGLEKIPNVHSGVMTAIPTGDKYITIKIHVSNQREKTQFRIASR